MAESVLNQTVVTTNWNQTVQSGNVRQGTRDFQWTLRNDPWNQDANATTMRQLSVDVDFSAQGREYSVPPEHARGWLPPGNPKLVPTMNALFTIKAEPQPSRPAAFTLVEVMLALAVSAIVLAAIGGVFFSALRLRDRTSAMLDASVPLYQALAVMRRDLQGTLPPGSSALPVAGDFKADSQGGVGSEGARLQLFTSSGQIRQNEPWGDVQEVIYELRDSTDRARGGKDLVRTLTRNVLATGYPDETEQSLLSHIQNLEFACYDGTDWRDSWDTSMANTNLPMAVRVRIQMLSDSSNSNLKDQPFELIVPLLAQSRTNQVTAASTTSGGTQ